MKLLFDSESIFDRAAKVFYLLVGTYFSYPHFAPYADAPTFLWKPIWYLEALALGAYSQWTLILITSIFSISCLLASLSWRRELTSWGAFLTSLLLLPLSNSYSCFLHPESPIVITLGLLALTNCDNASEKFQKLALVLIRLVVVGMYFNAGISKILNWGIGFASENGAYYAIELNHFWRGLNSPEFAIELRNSALENKGALLGLSYVTLILELFSPLALLRNRLGLSMLGLLAVMQIGFIGLLQLSVFFPVLFLFVFFSPPAWLNRWSHIGKKH